MSVEKPSAPASGSQPGDVTADLPPCSEAARRSQPAPPNVIAVIDRMINEARRSRDIEAGVDDMTVGYYWPAQIDALETLKDELTGTPELAGPAGNE
jgi:hypothetical protein